jgi:CrcB protein
LSSSVRTRLLVVGGGALGTIFRAAATQGYSADSIPWATLTVNLLGTLLLGLLVGRTLSRPGFARYVPFLGVGVFGGFTTFGTMSVQILDLRAAGHTVAAVAYTAASIVLGIGVAVASVRLGEETRW